MATIDRKCDNCGRTYKADTRNLKRGWGRCCCKSCAAQLRERSKPGYDPKRVQRNNVRRELWNYNPDSPLSIGNYEGADFDQWGDCDLGIHD